MPVFGNSSAGTFCRTQLRNKKPHWTQPPLPTKKQNKPEQPCNTTEANSTRINVFSFGWKSVNSGRMQRGQGEESTPVTSQQGQEAVSGQQNTLTCGDKELAWEALQLDEDDASLTMRYLAAYF